MLGFPMEEKTPARSAELGRVPRELTALCAGANESSVYSDV